MNRLLKGFKKAIRRKDKSLLQSDLGRNLILPISSLVILAILIFAASYMANLGLFSNPNDTDTPKGEDVSSLNKDVETKVLPLPENSSGGPVFPTSHYGLKLPPMGKRVIAPDGPQKYHISQGGDILPRIVETVVDAPAVHVGDKQRLEVLVYSPYGIDKVYSVSRLDSKEKRIPLRFIGKEIFDGLEYERYGATWIVEDTHEIVYMTAFFAEDKEGNVNKVEHAWSDACGIGASGDWNLLYSCGIYATDGVQGGNSTIGSGVTFTVGANFIRSGSITLNNAAQIAIGAGSIIEGTISMTDNDYDGYPANSMQYLSSGGGNRLRTALNSLIEDCDDNNQWIYPGAGCSASGSSGSSSGGGDCGCCAVTCPVIYVCTMPGYGYHAGCGGVGFACIADATGCSQSGTDYGCDGGCVPEGASIPCDTSECTP